MGGRLTRVLRVRCCVAGTVLMTAFLTLATAFGSGIADAQAAGPCRDGASTSGFRFTCDFPIYRFQLGALNSGLEFERWLVPGFSCTVSTGTGWLECSGGNVPAGQAVTGKVTLTSSACTPYDGLAFINEGSVQWVGRLCDSGSSGSSGSSTHKHNCVVPRLVGKTLSRATSALKVADCKLGKVTRVKASHANRNHVLAQAPASGKHLSAGARVNVVVGR